MPASSTDGDFCTSTSEKRASYCSLRFCTKRGQCAVPGMMLFRAANIWQPLQMPKAKESPRAKKRSNSSRAPAWNRIDFAHPSPAPSTSP